MTLNMIVAYDLKKGIGISATNSMPWHYPEDLKRFKKLTSGQNVIMGRKTYDSIIEFLGKPLPNRTSLVLTRNIDGYEQLSNSVYFTDDKYFLLNNFENAWVIGGSNIYEMFMPHVDNIYATEIQHDFQCDILFPDFNKSIFEETSRQASNQDYHFVSYKRKKP